MRPDIGGSLETRVSNIYKEAGYGTRSDLVREAVRRWVNQLEAEYNITKQLKRDLFDYRTIPSEHHGPEIRFFPQDGSQISFDYKDRGYAPNTVVMNTGNTCISSEEIESTVEEVEGVENCIVPKTTGDIRTDVEENNQIALDMLIDTIYDALFELIEEADRRVIKGEETAEEACKKAAGRFQSRPSP